MKEQSPIPALYFCIGPAWDCATSPPRSPLAACRPRARTARHAKSCGAVISDLQTLQRRIYSAPPEFRLKSSKPPFAKIASTRAFCTGTTSVPPRTSCAHNRDHCGLPCRKGARVPSLLLVEQLEIGRDDKKVGSSRIPRAIAATLGEIEECAAMRMLARWVDVEQALQARHWYGARRIVYVQLDRRLRAGHKSSWETPAPHSLRDSCSIICCWRTRA